MQCKERLAFSCICEMFTNVDMVRKSEGLSKTCHDHFVR